MGHKKRGPQSLLMSSKMPRVISLFMAHNRNILFHLGIHLSTSCLPNYAKSSGTPCAREPFSFLTIINQASLLDIDDQNNNIKNDK